MSTLITNLPSYEVWVRKEYLTDHKSGHGEFVKGVSVSAKSIPGRAFYFETYLPEYAAMFDKLPISAFLSSPELPDPDMTLHNLQFWNCMDYGVVAVQKQFIGSMHYEVYTRTMATKQALIFALWTTFMLMWTLLTTQQVNNLLNISLITFSNWIMGSFVSIQTTE